MFRLILLGWLLLSASAATAQQIVRAEYFYDSDPGFGKGTAIPVATPSETVTLTFTPDISGLQVGFHDLFVRGRDASGRWTNFERLRFFKYSVAVPPPTVTPAVIASGEYFFDKDPGFGKGTAFPITQTDSAAATFTPSLIGLTPGFHDIFVRARDSKGKWSHASRQRFLIPGNPETPPTQPDTTTQILAAEYFINTDPGHGKGVSIPVVSGRTGTVQLDQIDIASLETGFHTLYMRGKDSKGRWTLPIAQRFLKASPVVVEPDTTTTFLTAAEFFIDSDPGLGMGTPLSIAQGRLFTAEFGINFEENLPNGFHSLYVRARNNLGQWSFIAKRDFFRSDPPELFSAQPNEAGAGDIIVLNGTNFAPFLEDNRVFFGESLGEVIAVNEQRTELRVRVPDNVVGSVPLVVQVGASGIETPEPFIVRAAAMTVSSPVVSISGPLHVVARETLYIRNRGLARLSITRIATGRNRFSISHTSAQLAPGDSLPLVISYTPQLRTTLNDTLYVTAIGRMTPLEIPLSGTGIEPQLTASSLVAGFGNVTVTTSASKPVWLINSGTGAADFASQQRDSTIFQIRPAAGRIPAGDSLLLTLRFSPKEAVSYLDSAFIQVPGVATRLRFSLSGTGKPADAPLASVDVSEVVFAETGPGGTRRASVDVFNRSVVSVNITGQTGLSAPFFAVSQTLPVAISAGQKTAWEVELRPTAIGTFLDTLVLATNGGPVRIPLRAVVPEPVLMVSRATVVFGEVAVGDSVGSSLTLRSRNRIDARLLSATLKTQHFKLMPITGNLADSVMIRFHFRPGFFGDFTDTLRIKTDGGDFSAVLSGRSPRPAPRAAANVLAFESPVAGTPITKRLALLNSSINAATIRSLTVKDASVRVQTEGNRSRIVRGDTTWVSVTFTPTNGKVLSDTLTVLADGPTPLKIALQSDVTVSNETTPIMAFGLEQNYPNPFNPSTQIRFSLSKPGIVSLAVFDLGGREVARLLSGATLAAGQHQHRFDASGLSSGVYLYRLDAEGRQITRKMILLK